MARVYDVRLEVGRRASPQAIHFLTAHLKAHGINSVWPTPLYSSMLETDLCFSIYMDIAPVLEEQTVRSSVRKIFPDALVILMKRS